MSTSSLLCVPDLNNVSSLKVLGLFFSHNLNWTSHFDFIISKLLRRLYIFRIMKQVLSHDDLVIIFYAVIRSVIDYASPVYLNPGKTMDLRQTNFRKRGYHGRPRQVVQGVQIRPVFLNCNNLA